jgi:hypothetical protein
MNWEAIGAIGELVSAVAVVLSLIYVALQLRQNTGALRSSTWQAIQESEQRFDEMLARDPKLVDVWLRGSAQGLAALRDPTEAFQFTLTAKQLVDLFHTHHYQHEIGMIADDWWQTWVLQYEEAMSWPGFGEILKQRYPFFRPSFQRFVDDRYNLHDA